MAKIKQSDPHLKQGERGQAMVEYALIVVLVSIAMGVALFATGPAIANVFSNVVYNVVGAERNVVEAQATELAFRGNPDAFWATVTWVANNPQQETPYFTLNQRIASGGAGGGGGVDADGNGTPDIDETNAAAATQLQQQRNDRQTQRANETAAALALTQAALAQTQAAQNAGIFRPSATPTDALFALPFADLANSSQRWRLDNSFWFGSLQRNNDAADTLSPWTATFFSNTSFGGTAVAVADITTPNGTTAPVPALPNWVASASAVGRQDVGDPIQQRYLIDFAFSWTGGQPVTGAPAWGTQSENYSVRLHAQPQRQRGDERQRLCSVRRPGARAGQRLAGAGAGVIGGWPLRRSKPERGTQPGHRRICR
ncbi:MAG: Flp family type IVb pilin [Blastochloris sp.]|nr:Flp family type IVb pilin [Blastochloris sp.]